MTSREAVVLIIGVLAVVTIVGLAMAGETTSHDTPAKQYTVSPPSVPIDVPEVEPGYALVEGERFDSLSEADQHAEAGATIELKGHVTGSAVIETPNVTISGIGTAVLDGEGTDRVLTINTPDVTVEDLWVTNSGSDLKNEDAGVFVDGPRATLTDLTIIDNAFGVWVDGVEDVTIARSTIVGRMDVYPRANRGNGIHLWQATDARLLDNKITGARDGIYYQWSSGVLTRNNTLWSLRYGVHYMYSDHNRLEGNTAFDNHAGFALMVSRNLTVVDNVAVDNRGASQHGILLKDIQHSQIKGNHVVDNGNGFYVYNAHRNEFRHNLVLGNDVGIVRTAGSHEQTFVENAFIDNAIPAYSTVNRPQAWNGTGTGNYWSDARTVDLNNDGISEIRYRPAGVLEELRVEQPSVELFANSPAFDAVRLAEDSFPVLAGTTIVDHHPLTEPPIDDWREYYEH